MKILFITNAAGIDYLSDCVFHGLVSLGHHITDSKYLWYLSKCEPEQLRSQWGKGFTIGGCLEDRSSINRENIRQRILDKEFDCVIYGSIWRCEDYWEEVSTVYDKNHIIVLDGEDHTLIYTKFINKCIYFKRELRNVIGNNALPISFAIPEEKICTNECFHKEEYLAKIIPGDKQTYIYNNEEDYYKDYQVSCFGVTMKKAGWDCMRHYEIIANQCLPYFKEFEDCPKYTMMNWPTKLQIDANRIVEDLNYGNFNSDAYFDILIEFYIYCKNNLTTMSLANYILKYIK